MRPDAPQPGILLIDDDVVFVRVLERALRNRGIPTATANSVHAAREAVSAQDFKYAVLDLRLGEENGLSLIPELLERSPEMRILLLTGYASIATAVHAIKLGAHDYLAKPADADAILATLERSTGTAPHVLDATAAPSPKRLEWEHIQRVLADCGGNVSRAARSMGMHRRTLQRKLDKHPVSERR